MASISELPKRPESAVRFQRLRYSDLESRERLEEYDKCLAYGEPIAMAPIAKVIFETSEIELTGNKEDLNPAPCKRRAAIIRTILDSPNREATPYWVSFMKRHAQRIIKYAKTATNKGKDIDPAFK